MALAVGPIHRAVGNRRELPPRRARQPSIRPDRRPRAVVGIPRQSGSGPRAPRIRSIACCGMLPEARAAPTRSRSANVDVFVLFHRAISALSPCATPTDCRAACHYLLRGHGSTQGTGANLLVLPAVRWRVSRALMKLGSRRRHGAARRARRILDGASPAYLPLFPANWDRPRTIDEAPAIVDDRTSSRIDARWSLRMPLTASAPRRSEFRSLSPHGFHRVVYYEWGDADNARVVVCVHGVGRNGRDFDVLGEALATDASRPGDRHARAAAKAIGSPTRTTTSFRPISPRSSR